MRPLVLLTLLAAAFPSVRAAASAPVQTEHLQSRLVAESLAAVPGTKLTLGLLLEHDPHWHTYWSNPGDSGLPTKFSLVLPEGIVAEPVAWPQPQRFDVAGIVNFGYEARRLVPVSITIPAGYSAPSLPVRASAEWLVCEVECIPGKADYAIELPVAAAADVDARWADDFAAARADVPRASPAALAVAEEPDAIVLTLRGLDAAAAPAQWQWFPETVEAVANAAQPQWYRAADGWHGRWTKSEYFTAMPADLSLVAVDEIGRAWRLTAQAERAAATAVGVASSPTGTPWLIAVPAALALALLLWLVVRRRRHDAFDVKLPTQGDRQ